MQPRKKQPRSYYDNPYSAPETFYLSLNDMPQYNSSNKNITTTDAIVTTYTPCSTYSTLAIGDALLQSIMWLVNYLIIAKVSRELQKTESKETYLSSLSICLFVLILIQTLMREVGDIHKNKPHSHRNRLIYLAFSVILLICIHVK